MFINLILKEFRIYNQIKRNGYYNILNIKTDLTYNDINIY